MPGSNSTMMSMATGATSSAASMPSSTQGSPVSGGASSTNTAPAQQTGAATSVKVSVGLLAAFGAVFAFLA
jgi:hypothetical protein